MKHLTDLLHIVSFLNKTPTLLLNVKADPAERIDWNHVHYHTHYLLLEASNKVDVDSGSHCIQ